MSVQHVGKMVEEGRGWDSPCAFKAFVRLTSISCGAGSVSRESGQEESDVESWIDENVQCLGM